MGFETGIHLGKRDSGNQTKRHREAAVECWFTSTGRVMPLMLKWKNDREEIRRIENIGVISQEKKWYGGIPVWEYRCRTVEGRREVPFTLLFWPEQCRWSLVCQE